MSSKVMNAWWYTTYGGNVIGIVKTVDEITHEEKFRIGVVDGFNEEIDKQRVALKGDRFYPEVIK